MIGLTGGTTSGNGPPVEAVLDTTEYPAGIKISDKRMHELADTGILERHEWHGEWNYTLHPQHTT